MDSSKVVGKGIMYGHVSVFANKLFQNQRPEGVRPEGVLKLVEI